MASKRESKACTQQELFFAAKVGNVEKIHELITTKSVCVDCTDGNGKTALMLAAEFGRIRAVNSLLAHGADPRLKNKRGMTASAFADFSGHKGVLNFLENSTPTPEGAPI